MLFWLGATLWDFCVAFSPPCKQMGKQRSLWLGCVKSQLQSLKVTLTVPLNSPLQLGSALVFSLISHMFQREPLLYKCWTSRLLFFFQTLPYPCTLHCCVCFPFSQVDQSSWLRRRQDRCRQSPWSPAKRNLTPLRLSNSSFFYIADHVARNLSLLSLLKLHLVLTITQTVYRPKVV